MSNQELNKRLKEIKIEDFIWVIYIGIILMSWYSNYFERRYFIYNDLESKEKYRHIMIFIFIILVIIYIYVCKDSYEDLISLNQYDSKEKKSLTLLSFIASLLIVISGIIYLFIAIKDEDINVEIAFN